VPAHRGEVTAMSADKPLAGAKQRLRREAYERKLVERYQTEIQAAEAGVPLPPPPAPTTGVGYAAALRASLDQHTKVVEALRAQFERAVGVSTTADLRRLEAALSLYARSLERR
jgi:hypothetical protein